MGFVANFIRFPAVQNFENRVKFDKVTESLKVGTFLRRSVDITKTRFPGLHFATDKMDTDNFFSKWL